VFAAGGAQEQARQKQQVEQVRKPTAMRGGARALKAGASLFNSCTV
jgi:hypothetical protein